MKPFKWIKKHPIEAAAIAAGVAVGGPMLFSALAPEAAAGAIGAGALEGSPALLGAGAGGASLGAEAAAGGGSALLSALPQAAGEDFAAQMAGQSMGGGASSLLGSYAAPAADPALLGGNTALGSPYSGWWDKATAMAGDKLKDPRTMMRLGMMAAQAGSPPPQGAPMGSAFEQPAMRPALRSQEDITKAWLLKNDPNTYRRIYGNPQPGAMA